MLDELSTLLHHHFVTDQNYYAEQQPDGRYRKKSGVITPQFLKKNIDKRGSIAIYQKNTDQTLKWICFDFDILKSNLQEDKIENANAELKRAVIFFCQSLNQIQIPYLLEFSGNRGFHIWITFKENTSYRLGFDIQQTLLEKIDLKYNKELIAIDLFPKSSAPSDGVGIGVKIPLSKHTKSNKYSLLLNSENDVELCLPESQLDKDTFKKQLEILQTHTGTSKSEIESCLGVFFDLAHDDLYQPIRIKSIKVENKGFGLNDLMRHWERHPPLKSLGIKITSGKNLNHEERKLLVGLLGNIQCRNYPEFSNNLLHEIFSKTGNYNQVITQTAIKSLASFFFPPQEKIEVIAGVKFANNFSAEELLKICIPKFVSYEDATFELSIKDIEVTKAAEINYLYLNDEAQSRIIINELSNFDDAELLILAKKLIKSSKTAKHYKHSRNEGSKNRTLVTLKTIERIVTSCILKQFIYFFDIQPNNNSHGYKPNKGFKGGYIFHPWLYQWIKFLSNISSVIEDSDNQDYYIVKTDIKSFYDKIPHDNLKRMLLGGVNARIDQRTEKLSGNSKSLYESYITAIFDITETITESKVGLPQGPAYARYLAELYLDNLDHKLDKAIKERNLLLYQRYVDDIFFVAPSEEVANKILNDLKNELQLLGLEVNIDKTKLTKIKHFDKDFKSYRSQAKYAVDRNSKSFLNATETQKDLAITEFMTLLMSDTCDDDLAFIFSHLDGVPHLDKWKREKAVPVLQSGIGRGSVYKHLFNFVLDAQDRWEILYEINKFTELQSEVLTSVLINVLETDRLNQQNLNQLIAYLVPKLTLTELVLEHLVYLAVIFDTKIDLTSIPQKIIIRCLTTISNVESLKINHELISYLNTELNDIKLLPDFVKALYPLCASSVVIKSDLNNLANTFYAKMSNDYSNVILAAESNLQIDSAATAEKFYYLLCLFSISNKNSSIELLIALWKYCAYLFNFYDGKVYSIGTASWLEKLNQIEVDASKILWMISTIVDGNIFRGLEDHKKVFERFHNALLVYIAFQDSSFYIDINKALESLRDKATFYNWLIDRTEVTLFPTNKKWFQKNVIENSCVILKKKNEILFRRPTVDFHPTNNPTNEHIDHSEIVVNYRPENFLSLRDILKGLTVKQGINKLLEIISYCKNTDGFPNIYCNERILELSTLEPFNNELMNSVALIYEDHRGNVESASNNIKNFISFFFKTFSSHQYGEKFKTFNEKYINNLEQDIDVLQFLKQASIQLEEVKDVEDGFYHDVSIAAALHIALKELSPLKRIDKFVNQYHKFNQDISDQHIYGVIKDMKLMDERPVQLLETVEQSLRLVPTEAVPTLALYLDKDIETYKLTLKKIIESNNTDSLSINLDGFSKVYSHKISHINETININGNDYKFQNIWLINATTNELQQFDSSHTMFINAAEHIYFFLIEETVYIAAIPSAISKIYQSIKRRLGNLNESGNIKSYPEISVQTEEILTLNNFHMAVENIVTHRDISNKEAEYILTKWLKFLPKTFHQPFVTLISSHVVMTKIEISNFIKQVELLLIDNEANPFLIKRIEDYNGTHRILYKDHAIGRNVDSFSPLNISENAEKATIITDCIISGKQISDAIKFYVTGEGSKPNSKYFACNPEVKQRLKLLKHIDICTVFYTNDALKKISDICREELNPDIQVNIIYGRDIGADAFFGTSEKIGEQDKSRIRDILRNDEIMKTLSNHLHNYSLSNYSDTEINKINLVARFQSLPKKCFKFLHLGLRHDTSCSPLFRILETNE